MAGMARPPNSLLELLKASIEGVGHKLLLESSTPVQFQLRKKQFQEEHAGWFALQSKHFEKHGLGCDGLVPWMNESCNGFRAE